MTENGNTKDDLRLPTDETLLAQVGAPDTFSSVSLELWWTNPLASQVTLVLMLFMFILTYFHVYSYTIYILQVYNCVLSYNCALGAINFDWTKSSYFMNISECGFFMLILYFGSISLPILLLAKIGWPLIPPLLETVDL